MEDSTTIIVAVAMHPSSQLMHLIKTYGILTSAVRTFANYLNIYSLVGYLLITLGPGPVLRLFG